MPVVLKRPHPIRIYAGERQTTPFARGDGRRSLKIAIDRSSAPSGAALDLVVELAATGHAELWSTASEGVDAVVSVGVSPAGTDSIPVTIDHRDGRRSFSGIWPKAQWEQAIAEYATRTGRIQSDVEGRFLAAAAMMERVDSLVVGDLDFGRAAGLASRANPMTPEGACALIGLVSRSHGNFDIVSVPSDLFYFSQPEASCLRDGVGSAHA